MSKQIRFYGNGGSYKVGDGYDSVDTTLPPGVYTIVKDMSGAWWCMPYGGIEVPKRIYGNLAAERANLCINAFDHRGRSTGFLLSGVSGSGKTMTAKLIAHRMMTERGYPVFLIDREIPGPALGEIFGKITQPIVILFEEIEKNYKGDDAETLLTLLDGVIPGKRLTIATCNEPGKLPQWFMNRPSRFYYHLRYNGFEEQAVADMLADCDELSLERKKAVGFFARVSDMAFDAVGGIIEELRCYDSSMEEVMARLNLDVQELSGNMGGHRLYLFDEEGDRIGSVYGEMEEDLSVRVTGKKTEFDYYLGEDSKSEKNRNFCCNLRLANESGHVAVYEKDYIEIYPEWGKFDEVIVKNGTMYLQGKMAGVVVTSEGEKKNSVRSMVMITVAFKLREGRISPLINMARAADKFAEGS